MYENRNINSPLSGALVGIGQNPAGMLNPAPPTPPALNAHLDFLANLNSRLYDALERAQRMADRFHGPVPQPLGKDAKSAQTDMPCLSVQLEHAAMNLSHLVDSVHEQLARLERI